MEEIHLKIKQKLDNLLCVKKIKNYLLNSIFYTSTSFGVEGSCLGGAYQPVYDSTNFSGNILIELTDGQICKSTINHTWLKEFEKRVKQLWKVKYKDNASKVFLKQPKSLKHSRQADKVVLNNRYDKEKELVKRVKRLHEWMLALGEKSQHIDISLTVQRSTISNSKGLSIEQTETIVTEFAALGEICDFSISERAIKGLKKESQYMSRSEGLYTILSSKRSIFLPKEIKVVVLMPEVFNALFTHFVIFNISADSIYYKQSKFDLKDFKSRAKVFSEAMNLLVKPRLEMSVGACDFSPEGWQYPDSFYYIKNGRLISPITSYRFANLLRLSPTPPINSLRLVDFGEIEKKVAIEKAIENIESGILITTLLGLHTQDESTCNFSVVAPMGIWINQGKMKTRVDCILRGNMFEILNKIEKIYRDPLTELPYVITDGIEVII